MLEIVLLPSRKRDALGPRSGPRKRDDDWLIRLLPTAMQDISVTTMPGENLPESGGLPSAKVVYLTGASTERNTHPLVAF
jgi:hypothetical protein